MAAQDQVKQIAERIGPHLEECAVQAFVMCAYIADADGKVSRIVLTGVPRGGNVACMDGLRAMEQVASCWGNGQL